MSRALLCEGARLDWRVERMQQYELDEGKPAVHRQLTNGGQPFAT